ncbi:hypothetical protein BDP81DRAFT_63664 [Colletotrichum phormii]|uniref:Ankyrin repeat protein n=1 Tax=Colletotrichum phormii TaxID=359342 RepID=A0AAI9ZNL9_9PEZI|nr:uncharacterized protein BDP81DRAFT_63664 [Colletotrichum phormii]KAK1633947.1 hypothetical protein BDP81DRAFT_63664 [Colletotrichum phormii]
MLHYLLGTWPEALDYHSILLDCIMFHHHGRSQFYFSGCEDGCILKRLLRRGAKTDAPDFVVTPLQIAVACLDKDRVEVLLEGGAEPNTRGNPAAMNRSEHPWLRAHDYLSGMTPLQICQPEVQKRSLDVVSEIREDVTGSSFEDVIDQRLTDSEGILSQIEALLRKHNAT